MKITISQERSTPVIISTESINPEKSEEAFPRYNNVFFGPQQWFGTALYNGFNDFITKNQSKLNELATKIKKYCDRKGWDILTESSSGGLGTTFWTWLQKDTSKKRREKAASETWKTINGVDICFLEFDEYVDKRDKDGNYIGQEHVHYIDGHVLLKKSHGNKMFSKKIISNIKLRSEKKRERD